MNFGLFLKTLKKVLIDKCKSQQIVIMISLCKSVNFIKFVLQFRKF